VIGQESTTTKHIKIIMNSFSNVPKIDPKKFKFVPRKVADPMNKEKVAKKVLLMPQTHNRIHKLACSKGISFSSALELMLDTEEAKTLAPAQVNDWIKNVQAPKEQGYASYHIFTKPQTRRQANGNTKGISRKT